MTASRGPALADANDPPGPPAVYDGGAGLPSADACHLPAADAALHLLGRAGGFGGAAAAAGLYLAGAPWLLRKAWGARGPGGLAEGLRDLDRDGDGQVARRAGSRARP